LEEIPSVVQLDARQLGKIVRLILGAERIVDGGRREEGGHGKCGSNESVVFASDKMKDSGIESRHGVGSSGEKG
jgi:hypothetical protein